MDTDDNQDVFQAEAKAMVAGDVALHSREIRESLHAGIAAYYTAGPERGHDYLELALWLRKAVPLSEVRILAGRWSEQ
jgi:hypothetical protein